MDAQRQTLSIARHNRFDMAGRLFGVVFGAGVQLLFAWTVVKLFLFLRDGKLTDQPYSPWMDAFLAIQFAVPHSLLMWPPFARRMKSWIPNAFYGAFYCVVTCTSLLIMFAGWTGSPGTLWDLSGSAKLAVQTCFLASWVALLYSLSLTGLGYQTGLTQWWYWLRGLPQPRRGLVLRGAYVWMRHPVYVSFLGLIWFTPRMSWDHVVLTGIWTGYIFLGSYLKDERMALYLGNVYREYQSRVPGYPGIHFGPLGRRPVEVDNSNSPASHPLSQLLTNPSGPQSHRTAA